MKFHVKLNIFILSNYSKDKYLVLKATIKLNEIDNKNKLFVSVKYKTVKLKGIIYIFL